MPSTDTPDGETATVDDVGEALAIAPGFNLARLRAEALHHTPLAVVALTYCAIAAFVLSAHDIVGLPVFGEYLAATAFPMGVLVAFRVFGETAYHVMHVRPFRLKGLWGGIRQSELFSGERVAAAIIPLMLLPLFSSVFTSFKISIPEINPFSWDPALMELDRLVHGGVHPWEVLQPLLGHPFVTSAVSYLYNIWQGMILFVYWQIVRIDGRALRIQFLLAFVLSWAILGSAGAYVFSSAGPCYYDKVADGPNPYAAQMDYLHTAHVQFTNWSVYAQGYLWRIYETGNAHLGGGISAMPSLHVGVALLLFLLTRRFGRWGAWLTGGYLGVILIGSVHLGWHYAIDGYVGLLGAGLLWIVAGWMVRTLVPPAPPPPPLAPGPAPQSG